MINITRIFQFIFALVTPLIGKSSNQYSPIVLIIDKAPVYVRTTFPIPKLEWGDNRPQITIFDNFYEYNFNPKPLVNDTIVFHPGNKTVLVTFLYLKMKDPLNFVINEGDTVTFNFINGVPVAKTNKQDINSYINSDCDLLQANKKHSPVDSSYDVYNNPFLIAKDLDDAINNFHTIKKEHFNAARSFLCNELMLLHNRSDLAEKVPDMYNLLESKLTYRIAELDFEQHKLTADSLNAILKRNREEPVNLPYSSDGDNLYNQLNIALTK
jgi:hypothetical protein